MELTRVNNYNARVIEFIMNGGIFGREREIQRTFACVKVNGSENEYVGQSGSQSQSSKVGESRFHEKVSQY